MFLFPMHRREERGSLFVLNGPTGITVVDRGRHDHRDGRGGRRGCLAVGVAIGRHVPHDTRDDIHGRGCKEGIKSSQTELLNPPDESYP